MSMDYAKWKQPVPKCYILYSTETPSWKCWLNYRNGEQISGCQARSGCGYWKVKWRFLVVTKMLCISLDILVVTSSFSKHCHWEDPGKGYRRAPCISSWNCIWMISKENIKHTHMHTHTLKYQVSPVHISIFILYLNILSYIKLLVTDFMGVWLMWRGSHT